MGKDRLTNHLTRKLLSNEEIKMVDEKIVGLKFVKLNLQKGWLLR